MKMRTIDLLWRDGTKSEAVSIGNNAAWICPCAKRKLPLIGRTYSLKGPSAGYVVMCDECAREFYVFPEDKDQGRANRVEELERGAKME